MIQHRPRSIAAVALVASLALVLAGCSRHTALTIRADLVAFLGSSSSVTVSYSSGTTDLKLPPNASTPDGGYQVDLTKVGVPSGAIQAIDALSLDFSADVTPSTDLGAGQATLYVAPASESNIFQSQYAVSQVSAPAMPANQATTVSGSFALDAQNHAQAFSTIQSGSFRIGVEVRASASQGGQADLTLKRLLVSVSLPPGYGLP